MFIKIPRHGRRAEPGRSIGAVAQIEREGIASGEEGLLSLNVCSNAQCPWKKLMVGLLSWVFCYYLATLLWKREGSAF